MAKKTPLLIVGVTYQDDPLITTLRVKNLEGESFNIEVTGVQPRFWTEKNPAGMNLPDRVASAKPSRFKSITGTPLYEIRVNKPSDIREVREFFYPHYCADVPWATFVRWIAGWTSVIDANTALLNSTRRFRPKDITPSEVDVGLFKLDTMYFDIETEDWLDTDDPQGRIVSIAIYDDKTDRHVVATTAHTSERQVRRFLSSQEALHSVVEHDNDIPPLDAKKVHVINIEGEDADEREAGLMWWFKQTIEQFNPDTIAAHNGRDYDIPYCRNRCRLQNKNMRRQYGAKELVPKFHTYPRIFERRRPLRPHFDTKMAYAEQVQGAALTTGQSSLAWMGGATLGYGKVPRTSICEMVENDPMMLAVYNIWDNVVAARSMQKLDLVGFYTFKTAWHNSTLHNAHSNMMLVEDMMGHLLWERDSVMPSLDVVRERLPRSGIEQGGFVMDAPTGVWLNAMELDNSKEYPSAIISGNLDPATKVNPADYPDGYPFPIATTPSGRVYRQDFEGLMPNILRYLATNRDIVRAEQGEAYRAGRFEEAERLNKKQRVMKENMNSWYGVLGSGRTEKTRGRPFRLADPEIGSDITEIARDHNNWNKNWLEKVGVDFDPAEGALALRFENIDKPPAHVGLVLRFKTIYQDTDSCKVSIVNQPPDMTPAQVATVAHLLCDGLNESFHEFVQTTLGIPKNEFFEIKPDAFYARYFQWGVKKRYAYVDFDGKFGYRGVELRRSSTPPVVKTFQSALFDCILNGGERQDVNKLVRELNAQMLTPHHTDQQFGQPHGIKKPGTQAHRAAMWSNKNLETHFELGDKPVIYTAQSTPNGLPANRMVALEWGENPADWGVVVDREASIKRLFANSNSFAAILGAFNTSWERALAGMGQADMGDWFS
jgi:DNA polymerase, archaea type